MKLQNGLLAVLFAVSLSAQAEQQPAPESKETPDTTTQQSGNTETASGQMVEQAGFSPGTVARAAITSAVQDREPTDELEVVNTDQNQLYFFTDLRDMSGQTAKHRWEYNGKVMAEVEFDVKGPRWRVWSSKTFNSDWTGNWKVSVVNAVGDVIKEESFTYTTAAATQAAEPPLATPTAVQPATDAPTTPTGVSIQK